MGAGYGGDDYNQGMYNIGSVIGSAFGALPQQGQEETREVKKGVFSKLTIIFLFLFCFAFVGVLLFIFWHRSAEPVVTISFVGTVVVVELFNLATIKKTRIKANEDVEKKVADLEKTVQLLQEKVEALKEMIRKESGTDGANWETYSQPWTVGGEQEQAGSPNPGRIAEADSAD